MVAAVGTEPNACADRSHANSEIMRHRPGPRLLSYVRCELKASDGCAKKSNLTEGGSRDARSFKSPRRQSAPRACCRAIEIERWRGLAALDRPRALQDNRGKRAKEESAHGCGFIRMSSFSEAAGRQRANHDRLHASDGVEVSARRIS